MFILTSREPQTNRFWNPCCKIMLPVAIFLVLSIKVIKGFGTPSTPD
jgi:hypothetical protein